MSAKPNKPLTPLGREVLRRQSILDALEDAPLPLREIQTKVSGTRGEIVNALYWLQERNLVQTVGNEVPRLWGRK